MFPSITARQPELEITQIHWILQSQSSRSSDLVDPCPLPPLVPPYNKHTAISSPHGIIPKSPYVEEHPIQEIHFTHPCSISHRDGKRQNSVLFIVVLPNPTPSYPTFLFFFLTIVWKKSLWNHHQCHKYDILPYR